MPEPTEQLVACLHALGCDVSYRRLEGKGHGDYDESTTVLRWLTSPRDPASPWP